MKYRPYLIELCFLFLIPAVHAQTRIMVGSAFGDDTFGNTKMGVMAAAELPFGHRYEFDLRDTFSPLESHTGLGRGTANIVQATGIVWLSKSFGVTGSVEYSTYNVTILHKGAYYPWAGPIFRFMLLGTPVRLDLDYLRQVRNGINHNGIETSRMQGGRVGISARVACAGGCASASMNPSGSLTISNKGILCVTELSEDQSLARAEAVSVAISQGHSRWNFPSAVAARRTYFDRGCE